MNDKKRYLSILNNFISGIGMISLGFVAVLGSINLYSKVINFLVYIFMIFSLSNLTNFLLNRKIVKNKQTLFLIIINILLAIIMIFFPIVSISLIPIAFSIYLFLNAIVKFINYLNLMKVNLKSRYFDLFFGIVFTILSLIFLFYPVKRLDLFINIIGVYCIILGFNKIIEFFLDLLPRKNRLRLKKKFKMTLPIFLEAFIPKRAFNRINKYLDSIISEDKDEIDTDLKVLMHLSNYSVNQFGHIDLIIDNKIYSYGNYDRDSRKLFGSLGDGVLFITDNKKNYIDFCVASNYETIVEYGIKVTKEEKELIENRIDNILSNTYEWKTNYVKDKSIKKLYFADKIYKNTRAKFYKFKSNEFKNFFIVGVNCTYLINYILGNIIFEKLKLVGVLSPGTYYEYLEENYKYKYSNVVYRKIYTKDNSGDRSVKN